MNKKKDGENLLQTSSRLYMICLEQRRQSGNCLTSSQVDPLAGLGYVAAYTYVMAEGESTTCIEKHMTSLIDHVHGCVHLSMLSIVLANKDICCCCLHSFACPVLGHAQATEDRKWRDRGL